MACRAVEYVFNYLVIEVRAEKMYTCTWHGKFLDISQIFTWISPDSKKTLARYCLYILKFSCKCLTVLTDFNPPSIFSTDCTKAHSTISCKPVLWGLNYSMRKDRQKEGRTDRQIEKHDNGIRKFVSKPTVTITLYINKLNNILHVVTSQ
jgi:hypothetical protein